MGKPGPDPEVTEEDILEAIATAYAPVMGMSGLEERFEVSDTAIGRKLDSLMEKGHLNTQLVGRARIWWLTDEGRKRLDEYRKDQSESQ